MGWLWMMYTVWLFSIYSTHADSYLDPCKAVSSLGDIALTQDDYDAKILQSVLFIEEVDETVDSIWLNSSLTESEKLSNSKYLLKLRRRISKHNDDIHKIVRERRRKEKRNKRKGKKRKVSESTRNRVERAATGKKDRLWDYAVIPYVIDANFSGQHKALFRRAMQHWENTTCVTFVERDPEQHTDYIVFTERPCGCCSYVGKSGEGPQAVSIGKNCDKFGIVVHELGHVVGFWHEHTRPDRDKFIDIATTNIMPGQEYNFNVMPSAEVDSLGEVYDYESIMHYARNTFSRGPYLDTIIPKKKEPNGTPVEIGQRVKLSPGDIRQANKLYNCPACGRTLQQPSGSFASPNGSSSHCRWRISATHGEKIHLNITQLNLPVVQNVPASASRNCSDTNYLDIRDGHYALSKLIGRYCNAHPPPATIISSESRMWIEYKTSSNALKQTFAAQYEAVCGGLIKKDHGFLSSPSYPEDYRPNKDCVWKIEVSESFTVAVEFQSFEIENHDSCVYDYLEVRDGHSENSPLIGKFCGYKIPHGVKSTDNKLWLRFKSDGSVQKPGFAASFLKEYDECQTDTHGCEHECVNTLGSYKCKCRIGYELHSDGKRCEDACGGYLQAMNGTLQSPSFPATYPMNKKCIWQLKAPEDYRITLNFTYFDLEGNNHDCEYDSVEVRGDVGRDAKLYGTFCGSKKPIPITSLGNTLLVEFTSDNTVQRTGFQAYFFTDKDECTVDNGGCQHMCKNLIGSYECSCHSGFTLHENKHDCKEGGCKHDIVTPEGFITSPNFPDSYPSKKSCVWHFRATPGHRVKLNFEEFELEPHQHCSYDNVKLFDGASDDSRSLGKFCGSRKPSEIETSGNELYMEFFSDSSVQRRGFRASHSTVCGGRLRARNERREIFSHAKYGDAQYEAKEHCDWIIQAPENKLVRVEFDSFEVEAETDCGYDYVEVFDGSDDLAERIGRYCGANKPPSSVSTGNEILLKFRSDDTVHWKGFHIYYYIVDPYNDNTATVTSPTLSNKRNKGPDMDPEMIINTSERGDGRATQNRRRRRRNRRRQHNQ